MTVRVLARGFVLDYVRNPINLLVLALVPVVFVLVAADSLADAAELLGGDGAALEPATAGWAAGFLAAVGMYFQVADARDTDRRLVLCGARPLALVGSRMLTGLALAMVASGVALAMLALRGGLGDPARASVATGLFAIVYLGLGAAVGMLARDPVNGTVVILFVWIVDVFFGPTLGPADHPLTRVLPTHFVALWLSDTDSEHAGWAGELGISLAWAATALVGATVLIARRVCVGEARPAAGRAHLGQYRRALPLGLRELSRNPALWVLLVLVPAVFVLLADVTTPHGRTLVTVHEAGRRTVAVFDPAEIHAGTMVPIAVASLAMLVGLFSALAARDADRRLCLAGFRPAALFATRLTVILAAISVAVVVAVGMAGAVFRPENWVVYVVGNTLIATAYALVGVLVGPIVGRVSGVFLAFLVPFLDVGIAQSPMLSPQPDTWAQWLPSYGGLRMVIDGALTAEFDELWPLMVGLAWVGGLFLLTAARWQRANRPPALPARPIDPISSH